MFSLWLLYFTILVYCGNGSCGFLRIMYSNCSMLILRRPLARPLLPLQHEEHADPQKLQIEQKNTITKLSYNLRQGHALLKRIWNQFGMSDIEHEWTTEAGHRSGLRSGLYRRAFSLGHICGLHRRST